MAALGGGWIAFSRPGWHSTTDHLADAEVAAVPLPVVVAIAQSRDVPVYVDGLGTVQALQTVTVKPQVDGQLIAVLFHEGQDVKRGDVLARIDPRTYQATLDQALGRMQQDQATLTNARRDLARNQSLFKSADISGQTVDTQLTLVAQLLAQVAQDQAQIDLARTNLGFTTVTAPIDGRVGLRLVDEGNIVHTTDAGGIVVLSVLRPVAVIFTVPSQALPQVAAAMAAGEAPVLALEQNAPSTPAPSLLDVGTLAALDSQVNTGTGTLKLKALFPNTSLRLWPGAFVSTRLQVALLRNATVVPEPAIQRGLGRSFVFVATPDGRAAQRSVTVIQEDPGGAVVQASLQPGEPVVVEGAARLSDGAPIAAAQLAEPEPARQAEAVAH